MKRKLTFKECPRPQFVRDSFEILDGKWDFKFDRRNLGEKKGFASGFKKDRLIKVPFAYNCKASGIGLEERVDNVWYQKKLNIKLDLSKRYILHLEGSDYITKCYMNGELVGTEEGGYHRESFDLTKYLKDGENLLVIKCEDDFSKEKPRGKQRWKDANFECWYVETTGIWKTVWLEVVNKEYVVSAKLTPLLKDKTLYAEYDVDGKDGLLVRSIVSLDEKVVASKEVKVTNGKANVEIAIPEPIALWEVGNPNLYDLKIELIDKDKVVDEVASYFGMRELVAKDGFIYMNGKKLYQKLVLDQGYFDEAHLTPKSNKALYKDIVLMMKAGFNGARKHQKVEDERFLYYADVLGYLLWAEMPSPYEFTPLMCERFKIQWMQVVKQQYNHPSVITWTPLNESWGVAQILSDKAQQDFSVEIYKMTKVYDPYRFVITNDGWEHTCSDIITIHHYEQDGEKLHSYFKTKKKALQKVWDSHWKGAMADGWEYQGQPIMITEFGGTAYQNKTEGSSNWGYGISVKNDDEYVERLSGMFKALNKLSYSSGYCYTQVTDVQQEVNGVLYENRLPKVALSNFKNIQKKRRTYSK